MKNFLNGNLICSNLDLLMVHFDYNIIRIQYGRTIRVIMARLGTFHIMALNSKHFFIGWRRTFTKNVWEIWIRTWIFLTFPLRVKVLPSPFLSYSGTLEWNLIQWCNTKYVIASTIEIPMESTGMQSYHEWNLKNTIPNCMKGGKTYYSGHCHVRQMDCCSFSLILSIC
jgi:hypothetical protein